MLQDAQARKVREQQIASVVVPPSMDSSEPSHIESTGVSSSTNVNQFTEIPETNPTLQESILLQNITTDNSTNHNQ